MSNLSSAGLSDWIMVETNLRIGNQEGEEEGEERKKNYIYLFVFACQLPRQNFVYVNFYEFRKYQLLLSVMTINLSVSKRVYFIINEKIMFILV